MSDIPEKLRDEARAVSRVSKMMADAKSQRNREAGDEGASYDWLKPEQTVEWRAADLIDSQSAEIGTMRVRVRALEEAGAKMVSVVTTEVLVNGAGFTATYLEAEKALRNAIGKRG